MINARKHFSNITQMKLGNIRKNNKKKTPVYKYINNNKEFDSNSNNDINETSYENIIDKVMENKEMEKKNTNDNLKKSLLKSKSNTNITIKNNNTRKSNIKLNENEDIQILKNNFLNMNNENKLIFSPISGKSISLKSNSPNKKEIIYDFDKFNHKNMEKNKKSKFKNLDKKLDEKVEEQNNIKQMDNKINNYNNIILYNVTKNKIINSKKKVTFFIENEKNYSNINSKKVTNQEIQLEKFEITIMGIRKPKFCCF